MASGLVAIVAAGSVTLGLLVVIVVLGRDSLRSGVCELATSAEGRWRGSKAR